MNKSKYLITLGISATAGALAGIISTRKNPALGGVVGAAAGAAVAAIAVSSYTRLMEQADDGIDYYSETSPLYHGFDDIEVE
ncbi:MAG: hypothetical protein ACLPN1_17040 [Dissulfurispiraceae bacterium]|jgi:stage V sporulation protein SpoVS